MFDTQILEISF